MRRNLTFLFGLVSGALFWLEVFSLFTPHLGILLLSFVLLVATILTGAAALLDPRIVAGGDIGAILGFLVGTPAFLGLQAAETMIICMRLGGFMGLMVTSSEFVNLAVIQRHISTKMDFGYEGPIQQLPSLRLVIQKQGWQIEFPQM